MTTTKEKWQEIANRGLQDRFDPQTRAKFDEAVRRGLIAMPTAQPVRQQESQEGFNNLDVPTATNLETQSIAGAQPEPSFAEKVVGTGEVLGAIASGATTGTLGFAGGSVVGALGELTGMVDDGEDLAIKSAGALTFEPKTSFGRELVSDFGELMGVLPPVMGGAPLQSSRAATIPTAKTLQQLGKSKRIGQRTLQSISQTKKALAEEIKAGNRNAGNIAMQLDTDGTLIKNPNLKKAVKLMGSDDAAYSAAINFDNMNNATRSQLNLMLDTIEANKKSGDPVQIMANRPVNRIGDSLASRVNKLNNIKKSASKKIGELINGDLGSKQADVADARDNFISALNEADIRIGMVDGKLTADTSRTLTNVNEVVSLEKLNNVLRRVQTGNMPAKEAHKIKRNLREMVSFDQLSPGATKVSAEIENAFKALSSELGGSVSKLDSRYKTANKHMEDSIGALKEVDRQLGKQIMIGDDLASSKLGALSKRIGSNLASREQVISLVDELDSALAKRGVRPKDDIKQQVAALADLEKIFKVEGEQSPFGFQGRIANAVGDAMTGGPTGSKALLDAAVNKFRSMNQMEFDDKMKALRALSKHK